MPDYHFLGTAGWAKVLQGRAHPSLPLVWKGSSFPQQQHSSASSSLLVHLLPLGADGCCPFAMGLMGP